jgi:hypothetical protein
MNETTIKQGGTNTLEAGGELLAVEPNYRDGQLQRVDIVTEGGRFAVALGQYSNLNLLVPAVAIKFAVRGIHDGLDVYELFDTESEANTRHDALHAKGATVEVVEEEVRG